MSIIERAIAVLSPERAAKRELARAKIDGIRKARNFYEGATTGHRAASWRPVATDANAEIRTAGARLRDVAREMCRNNPYAHSAKMKIAHNVVGTGIIPSAETQNRRAKRNIETVLRAFFDTPAIDAAGKTNLYGLQAMAMATVVESGEVLIRRRPRRSDSNLPVPFQIEVLEPDYLDYLHDGPEPDGSYSIQGVKFSKSGELLGYWMFNEHPGTSYVRAIQSEFVPAEYIAHIFRQDRPGQVRGASWFAPVIVRMRDFHEYADAQLTRQKVAACFAAFITSESSEITELDDTDDDGNPLTRVTPGMVRRLAPGESVEFGAPPGTADYASYSTVTLHEIAAGLGVSYEVLTGDLSGVNFSSGRMGWIEFQRSIDAWRDYMLVPQFLNRLSDWFSDALRIGQSLPADFQLKWTTPRREMISPRDEIPFIVQAVRAGLMSRSEALRKMGYDPEVVDAEIAEDNKRADSLGIIYDSDARHTKITGTAEHKATRTEESAGVDNADAPDNERTLNHRSLRH